MESGVHPADRRAVALLVAQAAQFADGSPLGVGAKQVCCASAARQLFGVGFAAGPATAEVGLLRASNTAITWVSRSIESDAHGGARSRY